MLVVNVHLQVCMAPIGLASNSLLEGLVFAHRCSVDAAEKVNTISFQNNIPDWNAEGTSQPGEMILITQSLKELQLVMSDYVGIVRNDIRLQRASRRLDLSLGRNRTTLSNKYLVSAVA